MPVVVGTSRSIGSRTSRSRAPLAVINAFILAAALPVNSIEHAVRGRAASEERGRNRRNSVAGAADDSKKKVVGGTIECILRGWEREDCLHLDGCAWCDTRDYGGACVTEMFAEKVRDWDYFNCTDPPSVVASSIVGHRIDGVANRGEPSEEY